jgi:hypothetical protein
VEWKHRKHLEFKGLSQSRADSTGSPAAEGTRAGIGSLLVARHAAKGGRPSMIATTIHNATHSARIFVAMKIAKKNGADPSTGIYQGRLCLTACRSKSDLAVSLREIHQG